MKIGIGTAFVFAIALHGALLAALAVNVSLDKPKRPEEKPGKILQATIVNIPPAKGSLQGKADANPPPKEEKPSATVTDDAKAKAEAEAKRKAELERQVAEQKKAEEARQKAIALKKAEEEKKKKEEEEAKKKAEEEAKKKKAEEEAKKKAEEEAKKKRLEEEAKKLIEEEQKRLEAEAKKKAEAEAKKKAEAEAKAKAEAEAKRKAEQNKAQANSLEEELLGRPDGVEGGKGLGSGDGTSDSKAYGVKVQQLIEQNWRIDPSMNGKRVVVTVSVDNTGLIYNEKCEGNRSVCDSALATIRLIGMFPLPPKGCKDCSTIVITMTPKL